MWILFHMWSNWIIITVHFVSKTMKISPLPPSMNETFNSRLDTFPKTMLQFKHKKGFLWVLLFSQKLRGCDS